MDFAEYIETWAKGDALQGKIMLALGAIIILSIILILKSDHSILKGMIIPLSILTLIFVGYGGYISNSRSDYSKKRIEQYEQNPKKVLQKELVKATADSNTYTNLIRAYGVFLIVSVFLFFIFTNDYYKGLSLGLLVLFTFGFITDTLLHHRLKPYLEMLNELIKN